MRHLQVQPLHTTMRHYARFTYFSVMYQKCCSTHRVRRILTSPPPAFISPQATTRLLPASLPVTHQGKRAVDRLGPSLPRRGLSSIHENCSEPSRVTLGTVTTLSQRHFLRSVPSFISAINKLSQRVQPTQLSGSIGDWLTLCDIVVTE